MTHCNDNTPILCQPEYAGETVIGLHKVRTGYGATMFWSKAEAFAAIAERGTLRVRWARM